MSSFSSLNPDGWTIVCISDTHTYTPVHGIPKGDVLIHAGDFSDVGMLKDMEGFHSMMDSQPHKFKVFIAGNHDITMHKEYYTSGGPSPKYFHRRLFKKRHFNSSEYADQCIAAIKGPSKTNFGEMKYLEDECCEIPATHDAPMKIYGAPWQPEFYDWAFNLPIGPALAAKWKQIPDDIDVLITHGPPRGILDAAEDGHLCGCPDLRTEVLDRIKPRLHIFGHIHESYGTKQVDDTLFVNASTCNGRYRPNNKPIVVFLPFDRNLPAQIL